MDAAGSVGDPWLRKTICCGAPLFRPFLQRQGGIKECRQSYADASALERDFGVVPEVTLREGLRKFAERYKEYYE